MKDLSQLKSQLLADDEVRAEYDAIGINVKIKVLHDDAIIPKYATDGSACFDLHAIDSVFIPPGEAVAIGTGLAMQPPKGWRIDVFIRSGMSFKSDLDLSNSVGKIDSDYTGEVMVKLRNDGYQTYRVNKGDRIAQAEINPVHRAVFLEVGELDDTERGAGGFGSTGK